MRLSEVNKYKRPSEKKIGGLKPSTLLGMVRRTLTESRMQIEPEQPSRIEHKRGHSKTD